MKTLFLLPDTWDLAKDTQGNIAIATQEYQQAQDIASSCRVFRWKSADGTEKGDDYYNQKDGIPYFDFLGKSKYPISLYQRHLHERSMLVNGVVSVDIKLQLQKDRIALGSIEFTNENNLTGVIGL